jgi:hypothetical protein
MENTLIRYIRDNHNRPYGVVVALKDENSVRYGYSLQNKRDKWDRSTGLKIALARASSGNYKLPLSEKLSGKVIENFRFLSERAVKYYKSLPKQEVEFCEYDREEDPFV